MKILIVKLSSIGDVIHTLPTLAAIKNALPEAEVSWVVESRAAEILRENPLLAQLIEIDTKKLRKKQTLGESLAAARRQISELRASVFDATLDFQGLFKSATVAKISRARNRYGFSKEALREPISRFLLSETVSVAPNVHKIIKNLMLAEKVLKIPVPEDNFEFPIFTNDAQRREAENIISQTGANFAILNPAGGWATKLWEAEKFGVLADKLWEEYGLFTVVTTAPTLKEKLLAEKVLKSNRSGKIIAAHPSLKGFYELAKRAALYVAGDTGPTHLAIAAGAPIVGIFGPTDWKINGSPNPQDICVERTDIACRADCNRRVCGNWICLDIEVETVFRAVQKRLGRKAEFADSANHQKVFL